MERVDSATAVAQAINAFGGDAPMLMAYSVVWIEHGYIVGLTAKPHIQPMVGGPGGMAWVDGESGCPIILRRNE